MAALNKLKKDIYWLVADKRGKHSLPHTVNTKVDIRFDLNKADWLEERVRNKLGELVCAGATVAMVTEPSLSLPSISRRYALLFPKIAIAGNGAMFCTHVVICAQNANRINKEGEFIVTSEVTRTQKGNFEDALRKLREVCDVENVASVAGNLERVTSF